jgi:hypothetical protein
MKLFIGRRMQRAFVIPAFTTGVVGVAADAQIDGILPARSEHGDAIDIRFAEGALLGMTVAWAADGPCGGAADLDLVFCPNCPDAVFLQDGRLAALGDIEGGGRFAITGEFRTDGASGTLILTAVTGCPADHTTTWAVGTPTAASSTSESTAIALATWG